MSPRSSLPALVGAVALVALPVMVAAQTPREHLDLAKQTLDRIERDAVSGPNASKLNELGRQIAALEKSYTADSVPGSATGDTQRSTTGGERAAPSGQDNWNTHLMAAERTLDELLGASSTGTAGSTSTEPEATGTTGSTRTSAMLDASVRAQLEEVRRHLTKFAAAASGASASGSTSSTRPSDPDATSATGTTGSTSATGTQTQSQTTASGTQTTTSGSTTAQGQVGADAAHEHLRRARQSLADLTALPQAQQLQGETRSQVSQLISQFNTLITTEDNWQVSYSQVEQTLNALLSGSTSAPATPPATGTAGTGGAPGALDPAVRSKLEEFQQHLQAFYTAAAGSTSAGTTTGTQTTGTQIGTTSPGMSSDVETDIAAIERIVNEALGSSSSTAPSSTSTQTGATGTSGVAASGQVTIDRAKLEQIRMHLQRIRESVRR